MPMHTGLVCLLLAGVSFVVLSFAVPPTRASDDSQPPDPAQIEAARPSASALSDFGLKLTVDMAAKQPRENVFVSPLSIFLALSMAETGSDGKTRSAIRHGLAVPENLNEDQLHNSASALLKSLHAQTGVQLAIANALWSDRSLPLSPQYVERCKKLFAAQATSLNFHEPSSANTINDWVSQNTRGKIPNIVSPDVLRQAKAVLTNAVYFHGRWEHQFDKKETHAAPFHLASGQAKQVQMMHAGSISRAYRKGPGFEAAALDYEGSQIKFLAVLPDHGKTPEEVLRNLPLKSLLSSGLNDQLDLRLPKFTLDFSANLNQQLKAMGMGIAFDPNNGGFTPMGSPDFYISDVLHKTHVEVDEEGTVAAASTAIVMKALAMPPGEKKTLVFDRPFAVVLCDSQTGAVLFSGVVYDPK